jgi:hypothetical protein
MEAIKVTDSFNDILKKLDKREAQFEKDSAIIKLLFGLTMSSIVALTVAIFTTG